MKRSLATFLQIMTIFVGICVLAFLIWEPQLEGRNFNASQFDIYFRDPFLAFVYAGSVAVFVALFQMYKLLGYARDKALTSKAALKSLKIIKYCAVVIVGFAVVGEIIILLNESDDRAGGVFMGLIVIAGSITIAAISESFSREIIRGIGRSKN